MLLSDILKNFKGSRYMRTGDAGFVEGDHPRDPDGKFGSGGGGGAKKSEAKSESRKIDSFGDTPVHKAARSAEKMSSSELKSFLNNPNVSKLKNHSGSTPLHSLAFRLGNMRGAKIDASAVRTAMKHPGFTKLKDNEGYTPLHLLAMNGSKIALEHPAAKTLKDKEGKTPADYYEEQGLITRSRN
jgi:ankyrin repeat protein